MKKYFTLLLFYGLLLCLFSTAFSQEKNINEQEFAAIRGKGTEKLEGKSYRVKMTSKSYRSVDDTSPSYFNNEIVEYVPPDRSHIIFTRKINDVTTHEETITIGQTKYSRKDNGNWQKLTTNQSNGIGGGIGIATKEIKSEKNVEYKYKGSENIRNQKADLYEVTTVRKYSSPGFSSTTTMLEKFWFDKEGMFLKTEIVFMVGSKVTSNTVREYEYDANIKIEAPIVETTSK